VHRSTVLLIAAGLFVALTSTAVAARQYVITSTKQISPSVLKQLKGRTGAQGKPGPTGATGAVGAAGPRGIQGPQGIAGPAGPAGATGATGPAGPAGPAGPKGDKGEKGDTPNVRVTCDLSADGRTIVCTITAIPPATTSAKLTGTAQAAGRTKRFSGTGKVKVKLRSAKRLKRAPKVVIRLGKTQRTVRAR